MFVKVEIDFFFFSREVEDYSVWYLGNFKILRVIEQVIVYNIDYRVGIFFNLGKMMLFDK